MSELAAYKGLGGTVNRVEFISTASTLTTLSLDQQGAFLVWNGQTSAARIRLPRPEAGMVYNIYFNATGVSTATKIISSGDYDIRTAASTAKAVAHETTAENGASIRLTAINGYRWVVDRLNASTLNFNSTTT